ncbi:Hypothetical Protein FCC1311_107232 [Hondaea fermentalgiana]|uniref:Uncharacterized protein n=1 Tax=Hondaea fermentalgiana TaxID=2315210 RepID=A0A2R5GVZ4_9STRA|nr:Hypothetical Protein FCC1311_107232 [Hondaea fermentalgiana]|eukprot:GBG34499.1 Hypothetical Protein FCC1311_107232 [Hondaea fermentalgiana]
MADKQQMVVAVDPRIAAAGMDPSKVTYETEKYCGVISLVIGFCIFPCICCCPCDERQVAVDQSTGRRVVLH